MCGVSAEICTVIIIVLCIRRGNFHLLSVAYLQENASFYEESEEESEGGSGEEGGEGDEGGKAKKPKKKPYTMDADHRLLLRNAKPLLQSRNAAVSVFVVQYGSRDCHMTITWCRW